MAAHPSSRLEPAPRTHRRSVRGPMSLLSGLFMMPRMAFSEAAHRSSGERAKRAVRAGQVSSIARTMLEVLYRICGGGHIGHSGRLGWSRRRWPHVGWEEPHGDERAADGTSPGPLRCRDHLYARAAMHGDPVGERKTACRGGRHRGGKGAGEQGEAWASREHLGEGTPLWSCSYSFGGQAPQRLSTAVYQLLGAPHLEHSAHGLRRRLLRTITRLSAIRSGIGTGRRVVGRARRNRHRGGQTRARGGGGAGRA